MDRPTVLVSRRVFPEAIEKLKQVAEVDYVGIDEGLPEDELVKRAEGKLVIVAQLTDKFPRHVLEKLKTVKLIANVAVGYDNIDVEAATQLGILVTNTPGVLTETTADFAFALLLATARRVVEADRFLREGKWKQWTIDLMAGYDVYGKVLGIIGLGRIGQGVARRARGFQMKVLYYDTIRQPPELESQLNAEFCSKEELLSQSDFVSLHVPLTQETHHLIGRRELKLMKPTAILINTSRGPVVDEEALVEALKSRQIAAAGLDVFEHEPQVHPELLQMSNVVLTPHIASASIETRRRMCLVAAENVVAFLSRQRPPNLVNPEVWTRLCVPSDNGEG